MSKWAGIELRVSTERKNIPYRAEPDNDVHQVIWLTKEPYRIDEIPELQRDPELRVAIQKINAPGGRFETFRCGSVIEPDGDKFSSTFNIGLVYRDRRGFVEYGAQLMIAGEILGFSAESDTFSTGARPFLLEMSPVVLTTENIAGWALDVWHRSVAGSELEAKNQASLVLRFLTDILSKGYA
jgi:hypothetical protein